jgi:hypothetical protein
VLGRRVDGEAGERVIFALAGAADRWSQASKLAATRWMAERVFVEGCAGFPCPCHCAEPA